MSAPDTPRDRADAVPYGGPTLSMRELSRQISAPEEHAVAVWNTLAWKRSDVVELPLLGSPLQGAAAIAVSETMKKP